MRSPRPGEPQAGAPFGAEDPEATRTSRAEVTRLLERWTDGDGQAAEDLLAAVHQELSVLARGFLRRERAGHTLETGALVNEAYLRLIDQDRIQWQGRRHFYGIAARTMRQILVHHARARAAGKRGGDLRWEPFEEALRLGPQRPGRPEDVERLDAALEALARTDPEKCRLVELRFFAGLGHKDIAELTGVSVSTVDRQWRLARAWLFRAMGG